MKNKVILIRNIHPDNFGGAETYQIFLAHELSQNGFEPVIFTSSQKLLDSAKKEKISCKKAPYLKQQNWSGWRNILLPIYFIWQLYLRSWYKAQFKKLQPVAINIQSRDDFIAATIAGRKIGTKIIWTDHIDFRSWVLQNVNQKFKNFIGKRILKLAYIVDKIVMISDYEKQSFEKIVAPRQYSNLVVMKNGVIDRADQFSSIKPKTNSFCYVGRLVDYKGINEMIKAFNLANIPNATLNIYGDGSEMDVKKYQNLAKDNPNIIFYGYTENPLSAISESEIFILPSHLEGLSMSLLDAMMLKKAIIATSVGSTKEAICDMENGLLIPTKNINALKEAMILLANDNKLKSTLSKNARTTYEKQFNLSKNVADFISTNFHKQ